MRLHLSTSTYVILVFALASAIVPFAPALAQLYDIWNLKPEYSYGIVIPVLSAFLIWRQREELRGLPFKGSWYGLLLILLGFGLHVVGQYSTMTSIVHYAFLLVIYGLVLALTGSAVMRRIAMPLLLLIFMVPLPMFFNDALSLQLQLWSSHLGVLVIRAAGISVFLDGNVIDLGTYQLQVAEACSGLRYLYPLMTLAFLIAYTFRGAAWKRAVIFLSSVPITVLMNSLRIGAIGITVEHWGPRMAEGLLHELEGWVVFMLSTGSVLLVAFTLSKSTKSKGGWRTVFNIDAPQSAPAAMASTAVVQSVPRTFIAAAILVSLGAVVGLLAPQRQYVAPRRESFSDFPTRMGDWVGQRQALDSVYLEALHLDDYLLANYQSSDGPPINFYVAYYQSQATGRAIHSPHDCMPAGGWVIRKAEKRWLTLQGNQVPFPVNRAVIEHAGQQQLVYYWFEERGRRLNNEQIVRWYLFWDALTRNRTDGALVRLVMPLVPGTSDAALDARVGQFVAQVEPRLGQFVPN